MHVFFTGERPYICDQCGASFAYSSILAKHKKSVHQKIRSFACQICDKRFIVKSKLSEHLFTHSGERPFVCDQCGRAFNRSSTLETHTLRVHQKHIRLHPCTICDKRFFMLAELKKHSRTHTGTYLYVLKNFCVQ